jgi:hypothetical protein
MGRPQGKEYKKTNEIPKFAEPESKIMSETPNPPIPYPDETEIEDILEKAYQDYRRHSRSGCRGQLVTQAGRTDYWAVLAAINWVNQKLNTKQIPE